MANILAAPSKVKEWIPHQYQENAIQFVLEAFYREGSAALFLDPGLGKTSITLELFVRLKAEGKAKKMLVLAPLRVAQATWPTEIKKWLNFMDLSYVVLHGSDKEIKLKKNVDVYIINYEGLPWLSTQNWSGADMLVMDELTRLKGWTKVRVKSLKPFLPTFKYRLGLTGTPVPNGLKDLFSQVYMLDMGKRFGKAITRYTNKYFEMPNRYNPYAKINLIEGAAEQIFTLIQDLCYRINGKEWIEVPEEVTNIIELELPRNLEKQYKELKKEFVLELQNYKVVTAQTAAVLSTKLRQFLSGNIYIEDKVEHIHNFKLEALADFIEDNEGKQLLVGYQYRHEAEIFKERFPQASFIKSSTSTKDLLDTIRRWNKGEIPLLFGHPQSIGHGLNLQETCNHVLFYSLDFNWEYHTQFIKRVLRQGNPNAHVFIHYLTFKGTIDAHLIDALIQKKTLEEMLLDFISVN